MGKTELKTRIELMPRALAPMMERVHIMWDRLAEGLDPNEAWVTHSQCFDPGLDYGGLGCVHFRVYAEKPE